MPKNMFSVPIHVPVPVPQARLLPTQTALLESGTKSYSWSPGELALNVGDHVPSADPQPWTRPFASDITLARSYTVSKPKRRSRRCIHSAHVVIVSTPARGGAYVPGEYAHTTTALAQPTTTEARHLSASARSTLSAHSRTTQKIAMVETCITGTGELCWPAAVVCETDH